MDDDNPVHSYAMPFEYVVQLSGGDRKYLDGVNGLNRELRGLRVTRFAHGEWFIAWQGSRCVNANLELDWTPRNSEIGGDWRAAHLFELADAIDIARRFAESMYPEWVERFDNFELKRAIEEEMRRATESAEQLGRGPQEGR